MCEGQEGEPGEVTPQRSSPEEQRCEVGIEKKKLSRSMSGDTWCQCLTWHSIRHLDHQKALREKNRTWMEGKRRSG